ncbi:hypothetical protein FHG87_004953 [Trinorchestia longiramus]|nr:hypothetical protein FHG87_004953 [Trinorchestia longiramus]
MRAPTSSQPQDEETFDRQAEDDDGRSDGCFKFAGQVLGGRQLRLPASFQRASSLPRRFARSVTPTPAGQEPEVRASARAELRTESSDVEPKSSKKRAASTSPSRNEFRRSLKERIPRQLRSLIPARMMPGYNLPPRPTRKAGPVGRTWVKVYDDITYMDDTSQEYYPIVGYTGAPVKVPEADPLPRAPTPPPPPRQRISRRLSPTPSQHSEYDNVPRKEETATVERNGNKKETDQALILQEISNNRMRKKNQEVSSEERQQEADRELILKELTLKQTNGEKEFPHSNDENSDVPVERPTARKRENTRFKGRRQKRSGTPVATDRMTNGFNDENVIDSGNQTFETIEYTSGESMKISVPEDEYIVPERKSSPPSRPKRGAKIYEGVSNLEKRTSQTTENTAIASGDDRAKIIDTVEVSEPTRPVRGVKVYDTVHLRTTEIAPEVMKEENTIKDTPMPIQTDATVVQGTQEQKENEPPIEIITETSQSSVDENETMVVKPMKPKRGVKVYEDIIPCAESTIKDSSIQISDEKSIGEERSDVPSIPIESTSQENEITEIKSEEEQKSPKEVTELNEIISDRPEKPSKPQRGIKLYEDVVPLTANITTAMEEEIIKPSKPKRGVKLYEDVTVKSTNNISASDAKILVDNIEIKTPCKPERTKKVYSGIDFSDKEKDVDVYSRGEAKNQEGIPPYATVQKNKDSQMKDTTIGDIGAPPAIPPKKRARQIASVNEAPEVIPPRPARHLKPRDRSAEAIQSPKRQKTNAQARADPQDPPQKPTRNSGKVKVKAEPIIGKVTLESGKTPDMSITKLDSESYENMVLSDPRMKFRSRPLPPTPGQTTDEGTTSAIDTSSSLECPAGTPDEPDAPSATHTGLVITASDESQSCNEAPSQMDLTSTRTISTADGVCEEGVVCLSAASDGLEHMPEIINVSTNIIEQPLVSSESVLQSSMPNNGPHVSLGSEVSAQDNTVRSERTLTCAYCGHPAIDSSRTGANIIPDQSDTDATDVANVNVVQASLQFRGHTDGERNSGDEVFVECIQKPCLLTAVIEPTEVACTELTATDKQDTDKIIVENTATENKIQSEELTASSVSDATEPKKECITVQSEPISTVLEKSDQKLSVAAETLVDFEECVTEDLSGERSSPNQCQIQCKLDTDRKLSVAAESVERNFVPESIESLILSSAIDSEKLKDDSDLKIVADRRLSVAAETVILNFVPESTESIAAISSEVKENIMNETTANTCPETILSVAAENIASSVAETVGIEENEQNSAGVEVSMHSGDARKMSIAAESINVESTPESIKILDASSDQERSCASAELAVVSVVTSNEQSTPEKNDRKISVAAENVALSMPDSIQVLNLTTNDQNNSSTNVQPVVASAAITSVEDSPSEEVGRKISIAAETVVLDFMPESTETLNGENLETANVVASDESGASSVAAVSVTTGNFANTVTNNSNDSISTSGLPPKVVTEASSDALPQLSGNVPESCPISSVNDPADSTCTAEQSLETSSLIETKAPDSLSGSQTSITDDDSVVSVVTGAELAESKKGLTNTASDSCDAAKSSDVTAAAASIETGDTDLKGGVTDINNRLEGISNFLDSMVRNFSPMLVDNADETFHKSDSSPSMDPVSTSSTNSVPACSVSVDVSATPELPLTNRENDDRDLQTGVDSQLQSRDNTDLTSSLGTPVQPAVEEQTSSHSETPASPSCVDSSSPPIATSSADGAVPAVSEGTVICDQKYIIADVSQEDTTVCKDADVALAPMVDNLEKCEQELDGSLMTCTSSTESMVSQMRPVLTVFDWLDSGLGLPHETTSEGESISIYMNGEWHRL